MLTALLMEAVGDHAALVLPFSRISPLNSLHIFYDFQTKAGIRLHLNRARLEASQKETRRSGFQKMAI
ncbi:hypothetical protein [Agrobacterium sp. lyk4-40-TYG-31]|uniref:hypothetical protein n=1 Tax=Agrobacterium sp. lyk4-40-TYG-31 TaxID=3040276 RepID=UPI00254A353A|nr:hypothetical protein [Agrobacterium sp. lyk4-40-TYG-31]